MKFRSVQYLVMVWILLLGSNLLFSQEKGIPDGYYDGTESLSGASLKTALYHIIKGHTDLGYDGLYNAYKTTDNIVIDGVSKVYDMYSIKADGTADYYYSHTTADHCGNYTGEGDCYNREHSFPQSWFGTGTPKSDAFQVYPTDGYVNGRRGNYPYGEVTSPTWTSSNGSKVGSCSYTGYSGTVFEPIDEYKGDFARTYFYMATRYENVIASWPGSPMTDGTSFPCYTVWAQNLLIDWNNQDPISAKEISRNEAVFLLQHNRNPFIDHPEFVAKIWGGNSPSVISNITIQPTVPTQADAVTVSATITDTEGISTTFLKWGSLSNSLNNSIAMFTASGNLFATQTAIPAQSATAVVYYKIEVTDENGVVTSSPEYSYTIASSDMAAPVISVTPPDGAIQVPISSKITINSNEPLKNSDGDPLDAIFINSVVSISNNQGSISYTVSISSDQKQIALTPGNNLIYQTIYAVSINNQAFADAAGNKTQPVQTTFTTINQPDISAPELEFNIPNQATEIAINTPVIITSNEPLSNNTGDFITTEYLANNLHCYIGNATGELISVQATIDSTKKQITVTFPLLLDYQTSYYLEVPASVFEDPSGNETVKYDLFFTTETAPDTQAPILSISPPANAMDVDINASIKINANESLLTANGQPIDPSYLKTVLTLKLTDVNGASLPFSAGINNNNRLITVWPSDPFIYETSYFIYLNQEAFADSSGNLTDSIETHFTTKPLIDTKAPVFTAGFPKTGSITPNSFDLIVSIDEPGKVYYQAKLKTETAPTIQELLESSFVDIEEGYEPDTISIAGLTENTTYSVYLLTQDKQAIPNTSAFVLKQNITTMGLAPVVLIDPTNQTICMGNEVFFVASASGTDPLFFEWYYNETLIENACNDTLHIVSATTDYKGLYWCKITNNWGYTVTNKAELSFIPDVFGGTDNQIIVKDTLLVLDLEDLLLDNPTPNGTWIDLDNSGALIGSMFNPSLAGTGTYGFIYQVTNSCSSDSSLIKIIVEGISPYIIDQPENSATCISGEAVFVIKVGGTAPFTYEWNFKGNPIASSDNDTLILKQVNLGFAGTFTCTVSNEWGIIYSEPASLSFYEPISAGTDNHVSVKNTVLVVNLFDLLLNNPTQGGEWIDVDQTGALYGSQFNPNQAGIGIYHFDYMVTNPCLSDTATVTVTVEWPEGVDESKYSMLVLYPNPSKGLITVEIPYKVNELYVQIYNPEGSLLRQFEKTNLLSNPTFDLSEFGKGIYFIKISVDSNVLVRKVVVD